MSVVSHTLPIHRVLLTIFISISCMSLVSHTLPIDHKVCVSLCRCFHRLCDVFSFQKKDAEIALASQAVTLAN